MKTAVGSFLEMYIQVYFVISLKKLKNKKNKIIYYLCKFNLTFLYGKL